MHQPATTKHCIGFDNLDGKVTTQCQRCPAPAPHVASADSTTLDMLDCTICLLVVPAAFDCRYPAAARSLRCLMTSCCMLDSAARFIAAATPGTKVRTEGLDTFPLINSSFQQLKATNYVFAGCVSPYQQAGGNGLSLRCWALQGLSERCCRPLAAHSTPYLDGTASCMRSGLSARWHGLLLRLLCQWPPFCDPPVRL